MKTLHVAKSLPRDFPPQVRYSLAAFAVELDQHDAILAARAVAELARILELDPDVLADLVKRVED